MWQSIVGNMILVCINLMRDTEKNSCVHMLNSALILLAILSLYQSIKYSYLTWGTVSQSLLLVAPTVLHVLTHENAWTYSMWHFIWQIMSDTYLPFQYHAWNWAFLHTLHIVNEMKTQKYSSGKRVYTVQYRSVARKTSVTPCSCIIQCLNSPGDLAHGMCSEVN